MRTFTRSLALVLLVLVAATARAQTYTGSVTGTVADEQGGALPGATVTLFGKTGSRTTSTDTEGTYRFVAVDPGAYDVQADMPGFRATKRESVVVTIGKSANIPFKMKVGERTETLEVLGEAPVVDVTSSSTDNSLSQDVIFNLPIRQGSNAGLNILNFLPGINNSSAYGGDAGSGNGLLIDGVDTRDPEGGTPWTFYDYNLVDQVQAIGIGAPAEFGAFSGAVLNTITKSGGNRYSGLFNVIYTNKGLAGKNISDAVRQENPALGDPAKTRNLTDITTQLGGPIVPDKLFFFASAERFHQDLDPSGPVTRRDEVSPRFDLKLTWQPSPKDSVNTLVQFDSYNVIGRPDLGAAVSTDELTSREDAPEWVWMGQWRHLFGSNTFSEVKYTGWWGFYDLNPEVDAPNHFDGGNSLYSVSYGHYYYADRGRHQVNASVSHFAQGWGKHDLKFGVEIERSRVRSRYGYTNNTYYYDYGGQPYLAYNYGYDVSGRNRRESVFAQDSWKVNDRLTLNLGVRMDHLGGGAPGADAVYRNTVFAPRLGFALDLTGDTNTVLKGSYGQYYEGMFQDLYIKATPGYFTKIAWDMSGCPAYGPSGPTASYRCPLSDRVETGRTAPPTTTVDPNTKHPRTDEFQLGLERALGRHVRVAVTGVYRQNKNFVGTVQPLARWTPKNVTSTATPGFPSRTIGVYNWANRADSINSLLLRNPDGFQFLDPSGNVLGTIDASRKYRSLMVVIDKALSNRWQGRLSYVWSKSDGTINNSSTALFNPFTRFYETPTLALVNVQGRLQNDRPHELKIMGGYQIPRIEVAVNAYWRTLSGRTYAAFQRFGSSVVNFSSTYFSASGGRQPFLEPRGSERMPTENYLDLRLEKVFPIDRHKISVYADFTNLFNKGTLINVQNRVPSVDISTAPGKTAKVLFGAPTAIINPRQVTLGARWSF